MASLVATLQTELVSDEKTLVEKQSPKDADWTLTIEVTDYSVPPAPKEVQGTGNSAVTYNHWNGSLNAAYQVTDQNGRVHDAQNVSDNYDKKFQEGASSSGNVLTQLRFWRKPRRPNEPLPVNAESDRASQFMDNQLWPAKIARTPVFPAP